MTTNNCRARESRAIRVPAIPDSRDQSDGDEDLILGVVECGLYNVADQCIIR